ncbi:MAG TPA: DEAD/DEAH box helicase [Tepidisphaeraceae bacterium]|nr:DEAD/DEAH box helicase [Tepidisphaeraceae bacterium]
MSSSNEPHQDRESHDHPATAADAPQKEYAVGQPEAFAKLGVRPSILRGLADMQFVNPSEIQTLLIPPALAGGDLLGQARTGTGKTAAFGIPILQRAVRGLATQAIILVPTRELCIQVDDELKRMGKHTPIRTVPVYGGQRITAQMKFLKHGPEILVGTPGRVMDLLERRIIDFRNIRFVVLDEVDRMLDIGFRDDIRRILSNIKGLRGARYDEPEAEGHVAQGKNYRDERAQDDDQDFDEPASAGGSDNDHDHDDHEEYDAPSRGRGKPVTNKNAPTRIDPPLPGYPQTIFVSATFSDEIETLARRYMKNPDKLVAPGADEKPTVERVEQFFFGVQPWDKYRLLKMLLVRENPDLAIVFCRTKHGAEKLAHKLETDGIQCREIHGNLAQNKRDRVMKSFRGGKFDVLVATDLASRGIDVADISHIINFDLPDDPEVYVHRVGRTARMGKGGKAYSFVSRDQGEHLSKIEDLINMLIPQATLEGFTPRPQPTDWTDAKPGQGAPTNRGPSFVPTSQAQANAAAAAAAPKSPDDLTHPPVPLPPPRSLGARIPITRRHKRRR